MATGHLWKGRWIRIEPCCELRLLIGSKGHFGGWTSARWCASQNDKILSWGTRWCPSNYVCWFINVYKPPWASLIYLPIHLRWVPHGDPGQQHRCSGSGAGGRGGLSGPHGGSAMRTGSKSYGKFRWEPTTQNVVLNHQVGYPLVN